MAEARQYEGSCHCGNVRYQVRADLAQLMTCNCSMCNRSGAIMNFVPKEDFKLLQGEDAVTDYQFGKKNIHHLFCTTCGVRSFGRGVGPGGKEMVMINARCLSGVDATSLPARQVDGRSR